MAVGRRSNSECVVVLVVLGLIMSFESLKGDIDHRGNRLHRLYFLDNANSALVWENNGKVIDTAACTSKGWRLT